MSWSYAVHKINEGFDYVQQLLTEFMSRTEQAFQAFHQRLVYLERRLDVSDRTALTDAQVERVLRKILAERFGMDNNPTPQSEVAEYMHHPDAPDPRFHSLPGRAPEGGAFVIDIKDPLLPPKPVDIDLDKLAVDPTAVPSEAFERDMKRLSHDMETYPELDPNKRVKNAHSQSSGSYGNRYSPPNKIHSNNAWS